MDFKRNTQPRTRYIHLAVMMTLGLIAGLLVVGTSPIGPATAVRDPGNGQNNPDLAASCGTDVIVILDESGSVSNFESQLETAALALVDGLIGTGSRMRFVEFNGLARNASIASSTAFQSVTPTYRTDVNAYLTGSGSSSGSTSNPDSYNPGGVTNWESALWRAWSPSSDLPSFTDNDPATPKGNVGAPLVVFITDGDPNTSGRETTDGSAGSVPSNTARDRAIEEIEALQKAGSHVLSIAVGAGISNATSYGRLTNLTEPNATYFSDWVTGDAFTDLNVRQDDALRVSDFSQLDDALRTVVYGLCAPSVQLRKVTQNGQQVENWPFALTVAGLKDGNTNKTSMQWVNPTEASTVNAPQTRSLDTGGGAPAGDPLVVGGSANGLATFQWTPNSVIDPRPWTSTVTFTETLPPGWTVNADSYKTDNNSCEVKRLTSTSSGTAVQTFDVDLSKISPTGTPRPGDTVTFGFKDGANDFPISQADIVFCDIVNNQPATITITKNVDSLVAATATDFAFTTTSPTAPVATPGLPAAINLTGVTEAAPKSVTYTVEPGTYTVRETEKTPWVLQDVSCTGSGSASQPGSDPRVRQLVVGAGQNLNCTFTNRETPAPGLTITKTPDKPSFPEINTSSVTYTVAVTNTTAERLEVTSLTDAVVLDPAAGVNQNGTFNLLDPADVGPKAGGTITANSCVAQFTGAANKFLAGGASRNCAFTVQYPGREAFDRIDDTVAIAAKDDFNRPITRDASARVDVTDVRPTLTVDKQNTGNTDFVAPSGVASYSIKVTNTTIEPITVTSVFDTLYRSADNTLNVGTDTVYKVLDITATGGNVTATTCSALKVGLVIQPGDANAYTCTFTVTTAGLPNLGGGEFLINNVVVDVIDNDTDVPVTGSDPAARPVLAEPGSIGVSKTDNDAQITEPGSRITYDIDIFNKTLTEAVTLTEFEDQLSFNGTSIGSFVINAGNLTPTFTSAQATLVSTNCDSVIGVVLAAAGSLDANGRPTAAGATVSCKIVLDLRGNAGDSHSDLAIASGLRGQTPVSNNNGAETPVVDAPPVIRIVKTANPTSVPESGGSVTYTLTIYNESGATDAVTITSLSDDKLGDLFSTPNAEVTTNNCQTSTVTTPIPPGGSVQCTVIATIKGEPSTPHVNTVTAQGVDDEGTSTNVAKDDATVTFTDEKPTIGVTKTAVSFDNDKLFGDPKTVIETGAEVTFDIVVENTSNETVWVTSLTDSVYGDITDAANSKILDTTCELGTPPSGGTAPGDTYMCSFTAEVIRSVDQETQHQNTVTAFAVDNDGNSTPEAKDDEILPFTFVPPTVSMTKTDIDATVAEPGGDVTYFLEITNTSNESVTITKLTDVVTYQTPASVSGELDLLTPAAPVVSSTCTAATIDAGKVYKCQFVLTLSGTTQLVSDVAKVTVEDNDAAAGRIPPATATADDNTPITDVKPVVEVVKTANPTTIEPGDEVTYTYTIFNRSTVEDIEIESFVDDKFTFDANECDVVGRTLTKDDGDDATGTDQFTCDIKRTTLSPEAGQNPLNFDHKNIVTVEASDDEIRNSEDPAFVTDDDDANVEVRKTAVALDKSDAVLTSNGDGSYMAVYTIKVENDGAAGMYTLEDTFNFGPGVSVVGTPTVEVDPLSITPNVGFDGGTDVVIVKDVEIAAGPDTVHTYSVTVHVTAEVRSDVTYIDCKLGDTAGEGSGLLNMASVSVDGDPAITDDGCGDIPGDLQIEKSDGGITVIAGGAAFDYTLKVTNIGGLSTGSPVTVTDVLPTSFEWVSFPDACTQSGQTLTCDIDPTLVDRGGESTSLVVSAKAKEGIDPSEVGYENLSYVDSPLDPAPDTPACPVDEQVVEGEQQLAGGTISEALDAVVQRLTDAFTGNPANNVACDTTPVIDSKIEVTKTDSIADEAQVINGQQFTYTLNVKNVGASSVDTITLADTLPANIELVSVDTGTGWSCNAVSQLACTYAGELAAGATTTDVVLTVKVGDDFVGTQIDNTVTSTAVVRTEDDKKTVTDDDTEVTPLEPTLDVGGFVPVCVSDAPAIFYDITPKGFVPQTTAATLTILDADKQPVDYNGDGVVDDDDKLIVPLTSGTVLWPGAKVVDGVAVDWPGWKLVNGLWEIDPSDALLRHGVYVEVSVNPTATTGLITYSPASSDCADPEQTSADLAILKNSSADVVGQGQPLSFTLNVTNNGPDLATDVVVTDDAPSQLTVTGVTSSDFTCSNSGNAVTCTRPELAVGASGTITVQAQVNTGVVGTVFNTATVIGRQPDPNPSDNSSTSSVAVPDVVILPPTTPPPVVLRPEPPPAGLPTTGSNVASMLTIAMGFLMAGFALMFSTVKRRRRTS